MRHQLRNATAVVLLAVAAAPAAFAHAHPVKMTPEKDSVIAAPAQVSMTFSEALEPKFSLIELQDSAGTIVSKEHSRPDPGDPTHLTLALPPLKPAVYTVHWVSVATDGHRLEGKYTFTVK